MYDDLTRRNSCLDGLRSFAIIFVLIAHSMGMSKVPVSFSIGSLDINNFFYNGWVGVELFFVLSGYLLSSKLLVTDFSYAHYKQFIARRFFRIAPSYYLSVLFVLFLIHYLPNISNVSPAYFIGVWFFSVISHFAFVHDYIWREPVIDGVFWSIPIEMKFYLILPFLILFIRKIFKPDQWFVGIVVLFLVYLFIRYVCIYIIFSHENYDVDLHKYFMIIRSPFHLALHGLLVGVMCSFLHYRYLSSLKTSGRYLGRVLFVLGLSFFVILMGFAHFFTNKVELYDAVVISPLFCIAFGLILLGFVLDRRFERYFEGKFWLYTSHISYALYLIQIVPLYIQLMFFNHFNALFDNVLMSWFLSLPFFIASAVFVAHVFHFYIEKPIIVWSKKKWA